jgi:hypothetical protein
MSKDILWQTKLAARLHDPAEKALVLLRVRPDMKTAPAPRSSACWDWSGCQTLSTRITPKRFRPSCSGRACR